MDYDIVLLSVPVMETKIPPAGIYYLKGELEKHGFKTRCFNLVADYANHFKSISEEKNIQAQIRLLKHNSSKTSGRLEDANKESVNEIVRTSLHNDDAELDIEINDYFDHYIETKIKPLNPRFVGLSIFTVNSRIAGEMLCSRIRVLMPDVKIVLGGMGVMKSMTGGLGFGEMMLKDNLTDYYITGEGEHSLVELLKGNENYVGINSPFYKQIDDLDSLAHPDYSDYANDYGTNAVDNSGRKVFRRATLTGSRGCVRDCTFCDINAFWKKYRYRGGQSIADEMIKLNKEYGVQNIVFSDSLINGSMKAFRDLCVNMADYHKSVATEPFAHKKEIFWGGQFIVRSERQMPPADYKLMSEANVRTVAIGIESASENVRTHMQKGYSNEDMYFAIDQLIENGIMVDLMFIVGYPTETLEDFEENIKFFEYYADRILPRNTPLEEKRGGIFNLNLGDTMSILEGTPLMLMEGELWKLTTGNEVNYVNWESTVVPGLDIKERVRRRKLLSEVINDLGYDAQWDKQQLANMDKNYVRAKKAS